MPQEKILIETIWAVYCHHPGGQVVATHFEDLYRKRRGIHGEEEVFASAKERLVGFKKSPFVKLNLNGQILSNEMLVYDGPSLAGRPDADRVVLEWARRKGVQPIRAVGEKQALPYEQTKRIESLEAWKNETDAKLDRILALLEPKEAA